MNPQAMCEQCTLEVLRLSDGRFIDDGAFLRAWERWVSCPPLATVRLRKNDPSGFCERHAAEALKKARAEANEAQDKAKSYERRAEMLEGAMQAAKSGGR